MELFTLGRGYYTETDIKEGARAFTGWDSMPKANFNFAKNSMTTVKKHFAADRQLQR